jgi:hypothetical protein
MSIVHEEEKTPEEELEIVSKTIDIYNMKLKACVGLTAGAIKE